MGKKNILIVDYGSGNLASVRRVLSDLGARSNLSQDPDEISESDAILLPGVGAFADAISKLSERNWPESMRSAVQDGKPFLGICVGMQLLADTGDEGGQHSGLGFIPGRVSDLIPGKGERVPHMGWNSLDIQRSDAAFNGIESGLDVFFAHSFHFECADPAHVIATTDYCGDTTAVVRKDNVLGAQFHPEISSSVGRKFLENFLQSF